MAIVQVGAGLSAISGKSGGVVFARNAGGAYMRAWAKATNPSTQRQTNARSNLSLAATQWALLDDETRQAWRDYAAGTPMLGRLNQVIYISGESHFVRTCSFRLLTAGVMATVPPITPGLPPTVSPVGATLLSDLAVTNLTLEAATGIPDDSLVAIYYSPQLSAGKRFFKGPYRFTSISDPTGAPTVTDLPSATVTPGNKMAVGVRYMDSGLRVSTIAHFGVMTIDNA